MTTPSSWHEADQAYQRHHGQCRVCIAAGVMPGRLQRCSEGLALWRAYSDAPLPHFLQPPTPPKKQQTPRSHDRRYM